MPDHDKAVATEPNRLSVWIWFGARVFRCWRAQAVVLLSLCISSVLWQCDPLILKWLIDHALPRHDLNSVFSGIILLAIVQCSRIAFLAVSLYASARCGQQLAQMFRLELFDAAAILPVHFIERARTGDLAYSLEQDVDQIIALGSEILPTLARTGITVLVSFYIMWRLSHLLTILTVLVVPLLFGMGYHSKAQLKRFGDSSRRTAVERSAFATEVFTGAIQIRVLQAMARVRAIYSQYVNQSIAAFLMERRRQIIYGCLSLLIIAAASTGMLGIGGSLVSYQTLSVGAYVAFYIFLVRLFEPVNTAVDLFAKGQRCSISLERVRTLLATGPNEGQIRITQEHDRFVRDDGRPSPRFDTLDCVRISFSYRDRDGYANVVDSISFSARRGHILLLDGPTGCGKSTLLKIVAGAYRQHQGDVLIDGCNIESREGFVGFALQHPILFSASLRENLLLGAPDANASDIEEALYLSCADRVVGNLCGSLKYCISQSGAGLSGGERQRIALARVLLQRRPILLLDEVMTAIDETTKREMISRLAVFTATRIVILVSHDPLCKMWADDVVSVFRTTTLTAVGTNLMNA